MEEEQKPINVQATIDEAEEQKSIDLEKELRCAKCNSKGIYTTKKGRVCRRCGHREKIIFEEKVIEDKKEEVSSSG